MPCGAGKTTCFSYMAKQAAARGKRVLIIVHRTELLEQASRTLKRAGLHHGIIAPGRFGELEPVAVASVQTLARRLSRSPIFFDFIIGDEAHRQEIIDALRQFPNAHRLGCTATPERTDGQGLGVNAGGVFQKMVLGPEARELIELGHLVEPVLYGPPADLDMTGVRTYDGDFAPGEAAKRVNKPKITGDAVAHYAQLAPGEPTVVFCHSVEHAEEVAREFNLAGFKFEPVHGRLDQKTRAERLEAVRSGKLHGITSIDIVTTGTDIPELSVGIWLRATKSITLWIQGNGRIMRPAGSKRRALILDHVNNWMTLGGPYAENSEWSLSGHAKTRRKTDEDETKVRQCSNCFAIFERANKCPECGHVNPPKPRKIEEIEGELMQVTKEQIAQIKKSKMDEYRTAKTWDEIKQIAERRGDSIFWAKKRWGRKFGLAT